MNTESFVMYESVSKQIDRIEARVGIEAAYRLEKAVRHFGLYGVVPDEEDDTWLYGLEQIITSIYHAQKKRNKGGRPRKDFDLDAAKQSMAEGKTLKDTAAELGISEDTLSRRLNEDAKPQNNVNEKVKVKVNSECMNGNEPSILNYCGEKPF